MTYKLREALLIIPNASQTKSLIIFAYCLRHVMSFNVILVHKLSLSARTRLSSYVIDMIGEIFLIFQNVPERFGNNILLEN